MPSETEARRCTAHDLAADAEGKCVVCRRASLPSFAMEPRARPLAGLLLRWSIAVFGASALGSLIALRALEARAPNEAQSAGALAVARNDRLPAQTAAMLATPAQLKPASARPAENTGASAAPAPPPARSAALAKPALQPATNGNAETLGDALQRERAEAAQRDDARRHAQIEAEIDARAVAAARRNVAIEMFSTSWCGVCSTARRYMQGRGIAFVDHDIDQDQAARARAQQLNPRLSVPVIDVGGFVMIGFSERTLEDNLDRAAKKRVGL